MNKVLQEVISKALAYIINQVRFVHPTTFKGFKYDEEAMERGAEDVTDGDVAAMLQGTAIVSNRAVLRLINEMTVEALYDEDAWVDNVADHIIRHRNDCRAVWSKIEGLGLMYR